MCLDDKTLSAYIDGELGEPWKTQVEEHLVHCNDCSARYAQLKALGNSIQAARIQDNEFADQKDRVWNYLKNSVISEEPSRFFKRRFYIRTPAIVGIAAAFVCVLALNVFILSTSGMQQDIADAPIPVITSEVQEPAAPAARGEMLNVSATDSVAVANILEDLSVEDILKMLDERGFEVDLRLKNVEELPVTFEVETQDPLTEEEIPADGVPQTDAVTN
ncbi:MAG: zf-HC2 domain-containing protein [Spirochaetia bacterium]|nr:zf-HC2 domain-containing protein [Spirochaetia bacterium]MCF7941780.1 zf-HC2 domain-containing protein [Spirochaetia bacterium]